MIQSLYLLKTLQGVKMQNDQFQKKTFANCTGWLSQSKGNSWLVMYLDGTSGNNRNIFLTTGIRMANGIKLNVKLPTEIQNGKWLLYPVSTSVLGGGKQVTGECNDTLINPLSYRLPDVASRTKREVGFGCVPDVATASGVVLKKRCANTVPHTK